jgi:glucose/arabinose dehydrogenase
LPALRPAALVLALGLVAAACSGSDTPPAGPGGSGDGSPVELEVTEVARGLDVPWALAWDPSGALWFTQRSGKL